MSRLEICLDGAFFQLGGIVVSIDGNPLHGVNVHRLVVVIRPRHLKRAAKKRGTKEEEEKRLDCFESSGGADLQPCVR